MIKQIAGRERERERGIAPLNVGSPKEQLCRIILLTVYWRHGERESGRWGGGGEESKVKRRKKKKEGVWKMTAADGKNSQD